MMRPDGARSLRLARILPATSRADLRRQRPDTVPQGGESGCAPRRGRRGAGAGDLGRGNERPNIDTPTASLDATVGLPTTVSGNISDPDGDPVALRTSIGTVTDNGNGT